MRYHDLLVMQRVRAIVLDTHAPAGLFGWLRTWIDSFRL